MSWLKKAAGSIFAPFKLSSGGLPRWLADGAPSYSGISVTPHNAMQLGAVWACVCLLSNSISTLPLLTYRENAGGAREVDKNHPLYFILHDQPNADMTAVEFWRAMMFSLLTWGNAFAEISQTKSRIIALTPLLPWCVTVSRLDSGALQYDYTYNGVRRTLDQGDVLHIKGMSLDGLMGLSPIAQARNTLGLAMAADEAAGGTFKNGMRTTGFFTIPTLLDKTQRVRLKENLSDFVGSQSTGKHMLLEAGLTYKELTLPPIDAQLMETRTFSVEEICRWYQVPPHMVGNTTNSTSWGTGLEQQTMGFVTYTLRPYLSLIEQAIRKCLLRPNERNDIVVEFSLEGLLRADHAGRAAFYSQAAQNGWMTRNEIRSLENMPPQAGGNQLTAQVNLVPLDKLGADTAAASSSTSAPLDGSQAEKYASDLHEVKTVISQIIKKLEGK